MNLAAVMGSRDAFEVQGINFCMTILGKLG
jgi:hypothetical protein